MRSRQSEIFQWGRFLRQSLDGEFSHAELQTLQLESVGLGGPLSGYAEKNLIPGKTIVCKTGLHWVVMRWSLLVGFILCAAGIAALVEAREWIAANGYASHEAFLVLGAGALIVGIVVIAQGMIKRGVTEIAVSNKRVLIKAGYFSRKSTEVLLTKVERNGSRATERW